MRPRLTPRAPLLDYADRGLSLPAAGWRRDQRLRLHLDMRISLDELLAFERSGHVRWLEPKGFLLAGGLLPRVDFLLEFEALSGRTYLCAVTKVDPDAVQLECPAENFAGIWFADIAALKSTATDRKADSAEDHEIEDLARKHGTTKARVMEVARQTGSRSREQIEAALDKQSQHDTPKPAKRAGSDRAQ